MTCPRCQGCLVPDLEPGVPPTTRCVNCGYRPPVVRSPDRVITRHPERLSRSVVRARRAEALAVLAACAADLGRSPSRERFDRWAVARGAIWRSHHLSGCPRRAGWRAWPDVLRAAGLTPTREQIARSRAQRIRGDR